jgi:hypothetical protein
MQKIFDKAEISKLNAIFKNNDRNIQQKMAEMEKVEVLLAFWGYKKGGRFKSSGYRKRYFVLKADNRLRYYVDFESYIRKREQGSMTVIGMTVKKREGSEIIAASASTSFPEGKECFTFTIRGGEGTRMSIFRDVQCAVETKEERSKFLNTIESIAAMEKGT